MIAFHYVVFFSKIPFEGNEHLEVPATYSLRVFALEKTKIKRSHNIVMHTAQQNDMLKYNSNEQ